MFSCITSIFKPHRNPTPDITPDITSTASTSSAITQPQTFHLFPQLPTELQLQILEYAIFRTEVQDGYFGYWLPMEALEHAVSATKDRASRVEGVRFDPFFYSLIQRSMRHGYRTRNALLATCRLARLVALQAWKGDVECMVTAGMVVIDNGVDRVVDDEVKRDIGETVDALIEGVKGRM